MLIPVLLGNDTKWIFVIGSPSNLSDILCNIDLILPLLTEVADQIKIEEATKDFGIEMSNWLPSLLKDDVAKFERDFKKFYDDNPDIFGDSVDWSLKR